MKVTLIYVSRHTDRYDGANSSFLLVKVPPKKERERGREERKKRKKKKEKRKGKRKKRKEKKRRGGLLVCPDLTKSWRCHF